MRSLRAWRPVAAGLGIAMSVGMLLAGCGAGSTSTGTTNSATHCTVTTPGHLVQSGKLTVATDTTYAPAEFEDPNHPGTYTGYDVDLANEIGDRMCLTTQIVKATFGITLLQELSGPALGTQKWDVSISSWTINSDRQKLVNMIPYYQAGESILVPKGNPKGIKSINDMCGHTVAVQNGTVEKDEVEDANGTGDGQSGQAPVCKQANKPITILSYDDQTVVVQQVLNNRADASYQDQPVTDYYVSLNKGKLIDSGITVQPSPEGIVMRKDNPALEQAITTALQNMRSDGTYLRILTAWGVQNLAYPPLS